MPPLAPRARCAKLRIERIAALSYVIIPASPSDARDIARVHVEAWRDTYQGLLPKTFLQSMRADIHVRRWQAMLSDPAPDQVVLVAEGPQGVVGYCSGGDSRFRLPGEAEIATLYLLRAAQKQGLGRSLVQHAARVLAARGAESLVISVLEDNANARGFYERLGGVAEAPRSGRGPGGVVYEVDYRWPAIAALT